MNLKLQSEAKRKKPAPHQKAGGNTVTENKLHLLITVVGRNKAEYFEDFLQSFNVNLQLVALAHGTASESMLGLLGLSDNSKAVIFSVIQEKKLNEALSELENKFKTIKNGKGIAFTVPLSSVIGTLIFGFLSDNKQAVKENK